MRLRTGIQCNGATLSQAPRHIILPAPFLIARLLHEGGDGEARGSSENVAKLALLKGHWPEAMPSETEQLGLSQASQHTGLTA